MRFRSRVPLAWLNLTHSGRRLAVSVAGITSAVVLMFLELGYWNAMIDGQAQMLLRLNGDLVMLHALKRTIIHNQPFPRRRLYQAAGVDGVQAAYPLYVEALGAMWKNPDTGALRSIRVMAFRPEDPVFLDA